MSGIIWQEHSLYVIFTMSLMVSVNTARHYGIAAGDVMSQSCDSHDSHSNPRQFITKEMARLYCWGSANFDCINLPSFFGNMDGIM